MNPSEVLKQIRANPDTSVGICANYVQVAEKHTPIVPFDLDPLFVLWEHFSGFTPYPIPATTVKEQEVPMLLSAQEFQYERAFNSRQLWDKRTKYGQLRHELLDHLIDWSQALEVLKEIRDLAQSKQLPSLHYGICHNFENIHLKKFGMYPDVCLAKLFGSWAHYSGDPMFPIKDSEAKYAKINYKPWEEQARHDLLDHCIKVLTSC